MAITERVTLSHALDAVAASMTRVTTALRAMLDGGQLAAFATVLTRRQTRTQLRQTRRAHRPTRQQRRAARRVLRPTSVTRRDPSVVPNPVLPRVACAALLRRKYRARRRRS